MQLQGQSTVDLHPFKRIIGCDPSTNMLEQARQYAAEQLGNVSDQKQIDFVQSSAEDMGFLEDESVDLLVSCAFCLFSAARFHHG